jgi:hypothetical protein
LLRQTSTGYTAISGKKLEAWKNDNWLIGYFLRNEPEYNFMGRYGTIEKLNAAWKSSFSSFHDFEKPVKSCIETYPASEKDLREYSVFLIREYIRAPSLACRAVDAGVDLPVLIGEFHCGALDRGLPATGLKGVTSQEERGVAWRLFVEKTELFPKTEVLGKPQPLNNFRLFFKIMPPCRIIPL